MSSSWTVKENKVFETALATFDKDTPDRWENVARTVGGGKTVDDVERHYAKLIQDLREMEAEGLMGSLFADGGGSSKDDEEQRLIRYLRLLQG